MDNQGYQNNGHRCKTANSWVWAGLRDPWGCIQAEFHKVSLENLNFGLLLINFKKTMTYVLIILAAHCGAAGVGDELDYWGVERHLSPKQKFNGWLEGGKPAAALEGRTSPW